MEKLTITEALSECKLIAKKIESANKSFLSSLTRFEHENDIHEKQGGSVVYLQRQIQSAQDNAGRLERIRRAVAASNANNKIEVLGESKTVTEWLAWRKELSSAQKSVLSSAINIINSKKAEVAQRPSFYKMDKDAEPRLARLVVNAELEPLENKLLNLVEIEEKLDGQLSLKNATTTIEF